MNKTIGTVVITFDEKGKTIDATFTPKLAIKFDDELCKQMKTISSGNDTGIIMENAHLIFGKWLAELNEIELADREQYDVVGYLSNAIRFDSGKIKSCTIEYVYKTVAAKPSDKIVN